MGADRPPTKIFFVLVTICKEKDKRGRGILIRIYVSVFSSLSSFYRKNCQAGQIGRRRHSLKEEEKLEDEELSLVYPPHTLSPPVG